MKHPRVSCSSVCRPEGKMSRASPLPHLFLMCENKVVKRDDSEADSAQKHRIKPVSFSPGSSHVGRVWPTTMGPSVKGRLWLPCLSAAAISHVSSRYKFRPDEGTAKSNKDSRSGLHKLHPSLSCIYKPSHLFCFCHSYICTFISVNDPSTSSSTHLCLTCCQKVWKNPTLELWDISNVYPLSWWRHPHSFFLVSSWLSVTPLLHITLSIFSRWRSFANMAKPPCQRKWLPLNLAGPAAFLA